MSPSNSTTTFARPPAWALALCAALLAVPAPTAPAEKKSEPKGPDDLLIVDCLLPQRVRRLGRQNTYLAPRQPIRTTAVDCRIRGGEYTEPDQANYATSLKVWLPQAKAGSAEAQYFVGQIFEKGLGTTPDYGAAAEWYTKAAEQNYGPAQIGLGYLYEEGLGVAQDDVQALNWYRRAAGLAEDLVVLQQEDYDALLEAQAELERSQQSVKELEAEINELRQQLMTAAAEGDEEKQRRATLERLLKRLEGDFESQKKELDEGRLKVAQLEKALQESAAAASPAAGSSAFGDIAFGDYHALVIGNSSYQSLPPIESARSEAEKVAGLLEQRYGFDVQLMLDADRFGIMNALNELREELTSDDHLLVYYVGHGQRDDDGQTAFWQPVDAEPDSPVNWIPSAVISEHLDLIASNHVFLVANSVFAGLRTRSSVARLKTALTDEERYYHVKQLLEKRSRLVLASGQSQSSPGGGFAEAFLSALESNDGLLEASKLYQNVNRSLHEDQKDAGGLEFATMKWARNDLADFFFVPKSNR